MKLFELRKGRPLVYVDMDGVLADFFGELSKQHSVDHWTEIPDGEDAVVKSANEKGFFENLPKLPNADTLIDNIVDMVGTYNILSSPLQSNTEQSASEKSAWIDKNINPKPAQRIFDHNKYKYATQEDGTPNILIDDYPYNIKLWQARGGIGIQYKDRWSEDVIKELKTALKNVKQAEIAEELEINVPDNDAIYTGKDVLKYVKDTHHKYNLPKPILNHNAWVLVNFPVAELHIRQNGKGEDPYGRDNEIDFDTVAGVDMKTLGTKPIVVDDNNWIIDGNHRATAARMFGMKKIPAFCPYQHALKILQ